MGAQLSGLSSKELAWFWTIPPSTRFVATISDVGRPPGFDRQEVLAAVERQFRRTGYVGTSLDEISAVTGLGRGSLYAAFGDKHALFLCALADYCEQNDAEQVAALRGPDETALERLRGYLTGLVESWFADPEQLGCMTGRFAVELGGRDPEAAARIRRSFDVLRDAIVDCLRAAQRHGDVDPRAEPLPLATMLLAQARGIEVLANTGLDREELLAVVEAALARLPAPPARR
jgi:AcrR family transcriptional regulator